MKNFKIVCRSSALSVIQANIARDYLLKAAPDTQVEIVLKETSGDVDRSRPLYEMEGRDFFSKEIDQILLSGGADFAVHSMKDLSRERIEDSRFCNAVPERNDPRDVVIFNPAVEQKLVNGEPIVVGTSSLRRQLQCIEFLKKALPIHIGKPAQPIAAVIRGNVDSRLQQLQQGKFDAIILAAAGLNRLLEAGNVTVAELLKDKKKMFLPLIECAPAPGQGALLIECLATHKEAISVLQKVNNTVLSDQLKKEREAVSGLGGGCHQKFGSVYIATSEGGLINIAGEDTNGKDISDMLFDVKLDVGDRKIFSAGDHMKDFFRYEFAKEVNDILKPVVFIAHHRAVSPAIKEQLSGKRIWCSGSRTWRELAKLGIWSEGCADGMGFDFVRDVLKSPMVDIGRTEVTIITHSAGAGEWAKEGLHSIGSYTLVASPSQQVQEEISKADIIYWTNFEQYKACKHLLKDSVTHLCPGGKTADNFNKEGLKPVIFPGIKAFNVWRKKTTT